MSLHVNHRRKNKYRNHRPRWWTDLRPYKKMYWRKHRARVRDHISHGRYSEIQDRHPDSILWDAL